MMNALDHRIVLRASMTSSGCILFSIYARYGCIQVILTIMTSYGSGLSSSATISAPESAADWGFCIFVPDDLVAWIDRSIISSQKTPDGIGRHWDLILARISASLLLDLLMCDTLHQSKVPSK
jgi:hypothetical protein